MSDKKTQKVFAVGYENRKLSCADRRERAKFHGSPILACARVCVCVDCALPSEWCLRAGSRKTRVSLNISNELRAFSGKSFWMDWIFMLKFIKKYIFYKFSIYKIYFFKIWN